MALTTAGLVASCTGPNPSYLPPVTGCEAGERGCLGGRPTECIPGDGGTQLVSARCPASGGCMSGRCTPPAPLTPCERESDCELGLACTAFVGPTGVVATFCAGPEGVTPGGLACNAPRQCRSALCLMTANQSTRQACYLACKDDGDCAPPQKCRTFSVTVTGVQGTIQGCSPP